MIYSHMIYEISFDNRGDLLKSGLIYWKELDSYWWIYEEEFQKLYTKYAHIH